jgi:hypothetical protein
MDKMNKKNKIASVEQYLNAIYSKTLNSSKEKDSTNCIWFRGESIDYEKTSLVPKAYRTLVESIDDKYFAIKQLCLDDIKRTEQNISAEFSREALPYIISRKIENTAWNRYFLMQHYQIQTKLLDWTENALLALFFAIFEDKMGDAKVWILQPFNLNNFTIKNIYPDIDVSVIPTISDMKINQKIDNNCDEPILDKLTRLYINSDFDPEGMNAPITKPPTKFYPLAIFPSFLDQRMTVQKSCFTIFGNQANGLKTLGHEIIDSIIIDGKCKGKLLNELRLIGIDFNSIYPDLDGLGLSIAKKYEQKFNDIRKHKPKNA